MWDEVSDAKRCFAKTAVSIEILTQGFNSSLYHYLTSHPRVLPAKEKQIHYFKVHQRRLASVVIPYVLTEF